MKNKGFTLIELLAVIVILAIIALIATPIILGIINDAREQAKERTAELIAKETQLAFTSYLFEKNGQGEPDDFCTYMTNDYFAMDNGEIVTSGDDYAACSDSNVKVKVKSGNDTYAVEYENGTATVTLGAVEKTVTLKNATPEEEGDRA